MTTLIVTSDRVLVDSRTSFNYTAEVTQKWTVTPSFTYFVAGGSHEMDSLVFRFMDQLMGVGPYPEPPIAKGSNSLAVIVITADSDLDWAQRRCLTSGDILILESDGSLTIDRLDYRSCNGGVETVIRPSGSGNAAFDVFYSLTRNVSAAMDFAVATDSHSGFPVHSLDRRSLRWETTEFTPDFSNIGNELIELMERVTFPQPMTKEN